LPEESVNIEEFVKDLRDIKIKNTIYSFKSLANNLYNAQGSFGTQSNSSGSCAAPTQGSLFSPLGHSKGATSIIGNISSSINEMLEVTKGTLQCYSTQQTWAVAAPLTSDPLSSFCIDSKGTSGIIALPLDSDVCKI
jgi:hypothetical protein